MTQSLRLLLTGCALLALAQPATAQDAPIILDPPLDPAPGEPLPALRELEVEPPSALPSVILEAEDAAPTGEDDPAPVFDAFGRSAYGLYLSGRVASTRGDRAAGAALLTQSQELMPEQSVVADEAFRAALFSGDIDDVVRLTPEVQDNPLLADAGRLFGVVQALKAEDGDLARSRFDIRPFAEPYGDIGRYLAPVVAAQTGDWETALAPVSADAAGLSPVVLGLQRARLLELRGDAGEADAQYKALRESHPQAAPLYQTLYGGFLERRGRRDEALEVYRAALQGAAPDPRALSAIARMERRGRPPARAELAEIAAQDLFFAALNVQLILANVPPGQNRGSELPAIYLQLANHLAPSDSLNVSLGQSLIEASQPALAREVLARVSQDNPILYARAQVSLAAAHQREDADEAALEALRRADAAAPQQAAVADALARQLIDMTRNAEALEVLNRPTLNTADQGVELYFLRGVALERLGRLDEAEAQLWTALQRAPDSPDLLNYLGYLWVDSGRRVDQGAEMLARAHAAAPDNGNIQDSLGWAQFRMGQYDLAVQTLEQAVDKEPANAEINDHLGDAYWRVGRTREAGWQWSRVLTLDPEPERRAEVERKLEDGLPPPETPAPAPAINAGAQL